MSCCGKARAAAAGSVMPLGQTIEYEYLGPTTLTVIGPMTGQRYYFDAPGARVAIDVRDRIHLGGVPRIRPVARR